LLLAHGRSLAALGSILGCSWPLLARSGLLWAALAPISGRSWAVLGLSGLFLELSKNISKLKTGSAACPPWYRAWLTVEKASPDRFHCKPLSTMHGAKLLRWRLTVADSGNHGFGCDFHCQPLSTVNATARVRAWLTVAGSGNRGVGGMGHSPWVDKKELHSSITRTTDEWIWTGI